MRPLLILFALTFSSGAQLTWSLANGNDSWPADKRAAIIASMIEAVALYKADDHFPKTLWANYNASVPTAQASYSGWIDIGGSIGTRVALHEISHTLGVGTVSAWNNNRSGNTWNVTYAINRVKLFNGPSATLTLGSTPMPPGTYHSATHPAYFSGTGSLSVPTNFPNWLNLFSGLTEAERSPTADPDHNNLPNLAEYALGTEPNAFQADAFTFSSAPGSQLPSLSFHRLPARSDLTISVEAGATLNDWTPIARSIAGAPFTPLLDSVQYRETVVDASRIQVTVTDAPPGPSHTRFLRISITQ